MKWLIFLLLFTSVSWAEEGIITDIVDNQRLIVTTPEENSFKLKDKVILVEHSDQEGIAFGQVNKIISPTEVQVEINEVIDNKLVLLGDFVYALDYRVLKKKKIPGFAALTLTGGNCRKAPAKYKDLAYLGALTAEGHTLEKKEFLVSPYQVQYGIHERVTLRFINALWFDEFINLGAKYQIIKNKYAKITVNGFAAHNIPNHEWAFQTGGILTLPSNSKFQSHLSANFRLDPAGSGNNPVSKNLPILQDSDIRNITEYVTDSWNRILFGPVYNVELQSFGGTVSYMWVWDHFHMSLGFATRDFTEIKVGDEGYYAVYDLFWRF